MQDEKQERLIEIGYFPVRAHAQVCRLLCEYLHIPYKDRFLTPETWEEYKKNQAKNWIIKKLPFIIDNDFHMVGAHSIAVYLVQKSGRMDMLGQNQYERIVLDQILSSQDLKHQMLGMKINYRSIQPQKKKQCEHYYWTQKIYPVLKGYNQQAIKDNWFFGHLTVMDFMIYQLINYGQRMFPDQIIQFKELVNIRNKMGEIKQIKSYQGSQIAKLIGYCPFRYISAFSEQKVHRWSAFRSVSRQ